MVPSQRQRFETKAAKQTLQRFPTEVATQLQVREVRKRHQLVQHVAVATVNARTSISLAMQNTSRLPPTMKAQQAKTAQLRASCRSVVKQDEHTKTGPCVTTPVPTIQSEDCHVTAHL
jgi:hypothetical protein